MEETQQQGEGSNSDAMNGREEGLERSTAGGGNGQEAQPIESNGVHGDVERDGERGQDTVRSEGGTLRVGGPPNASVESAGDSPPPQSSTTIPNAHEEASRSSRDHQDHVDSSSSDNPSSRNPTHRPSNSVTSFSTAISSDIRFFDPRNSTYIDAADMGDFPMEAEELSVQEELVSTNAEAEAASATTPAIAPSHLTTSSPPSSEKLVRPPDDTSTDPVPAPDLPPGASPGVAAPGPAPSFPGSSADVYRISPPPTTSISPPISSPSNGTSANRQRLGVDDGLDGEEPLDLVIAEVYGTGATASQIFTGQRSFSRLSKRESKASSVTTSSGTNTTAKKPPSRPSSRFSQLAEMTESAPNGVDMDVDPNNAVRTGEQDHPTPRADTNNEQSRKGMRQTLPTPLYATPSAEYTHVRSESLPARSGGDTGEPSRYRASVPHIQMPPSNGSHSVQQMLPHNASQVPLAPVLPSMNASQPGAQPYILPVLHDGTSMTSSPYPSIPHSRPPSNMNKMPGSGPPHVVNYGGRTDQNGRYRSPTPDGGAGERDRSNSAQGYSMDNPNSKSRQRPASPSIKIDPANRMPSPASNGYLNQMGGPSGIPIPPIPDNRAGPSNSGRRTTINQAPPVFPVGGDPREVCVECMMRDRDMMDVDVTGPGVWARASDADFEEALRAGEEELAEMSGEDSRRSMGGSELLHGRSRLGTEESGTGSPRGNFYGKRNTNSLYSMDPADVSRENSVSKESASVDQHRVKKKVTKGHPLTQASLKLWTNMNPTAASHRWRTLQVYLADQAEYLHLEQDARTKTQQEFMALEYQREQGDVQRTPKATRKASGETTRSSRISVGKQRQSKVLPNGMIIENMDVSRDEREAKHQAKAQARERRRRQSTHSTKGAFSPLPSPGIYDASPAPSVRSYAFGEQPWLANEPKRRFSSPMPKLGAGSLGLQYARSSGDLPSGPRSPSPSRRSVATTTDRRFSFWGRRSATQSVYSFAPSGSMMDMHLGLSLDKHLPPMPALPPSSPYLAGDEGNVAIEEKEEKKKKKGFKHFFGKLGFANSSKKPGENGDAPGPHDDDYNGYQDGLEDDTLAPPPPLSMLVDKSRRPSHSRVASSSSLSLSSPSPSPRHPRSPSVPLSGRGSPPNPSQDPLRYHDDRRSVNTSRSIASLRSPSDSLLPRSPQATTATTKSGSPPDMAYRNPLFVGDTNGEFVPDSASAAFERERTSTGSILSAKRTLRREKSLPQLPPDEAEVLGNGANEGLSPYMQQRPPVRYGESRSAYSIRRSLSPAQSMYGYEPDSGPDFEDIGGGRKEKARSKVLSMHFPGFRKQPKAPGDPQDPESPVLNPGLLGAVSRDQDFLALKYT